MSTRRSATLGASTVSELVPAAVTDGRYAVHEHRAPRGFAVPEHVHTLEDELIYVLAGEVTIVESGRAARAGPGGCVALRRHVAHGWRVESERARLLVVHVPGALGDVVFADCGPVTAERLADHGVIVLEPGADGRIG